MTPGVGRRPVLVALAGGLVGGIPRTSAAATTRLESVSTGRAWPTPRYDGGNTGAASNVRLDSELVETWTTETDDDPTTPVRAGGRLFYGADGGELVARHSVGGDELWRASAETNDRLEPTVAGGLVVTAGDDLVARDVTDGSVVWTGDINGSGVGPAVPHAGGLYVTNTRRGMYRFNETNGEWTWSRVTGGAIQAPMAVDRGMAFVVDGDGSIYRLDEGERMWQTSTETEFEITPVAADETLYVITDDGDLRGYSQSTGGEMWSVEPSRSPNLPPTVSGDMCLVSDTYGRVSGIDTSVRESAWSVDFDGELETAPIVVDQVCLVGTAQGDVVALDVESGREQWRVSILDEPIVGVCGGPDQVHVTGADGGVGGAYVDEALTARQAIRSLESRIREVADSEIETSSLTDGRDAAVDALRDFSYAEATQEAEAALAEFDETLESIESLNEEIASLREEASALEETASVETGDVLALLDDAERALDRGDVDAARDQVAEADSLLEARAGAYRDAISAIEELEATISDARENGLPAGNAAEARDAAEAALDDGDFDEAARTATDATDRLLARIETADRATNRIEELDTLLADVDDRDIRIDDERAYLADARSLLDDGEYDSAITTAENGIEAVRTTVETAETSLALIRECESFSPVQPGAQALAERRGSEEQIRAARDAYEAGEYERSLALAREARTTQRRSRWIVDGTIGTTTVGGLALYRYGSLDRPTRWITEHTNLLTVEEEDAEDS